MKAYCFFSVYEALFREVAAQLREHGVTSFSGFVWGQQQAQAITGRGIDYDPLVVFTRDLLPACEDGQAPDLDWLARREVELGISIQRMLASERHLLAGRTFEQIMRIAEVALRRIAEAYDRARPDFVFSEDVSCFHSYVHFALARERRIPFWCVSTGRLRDRIGVYSSEEMHWERLEALFAEIRRRGLTEAEARHAAQYIAAFRDRPVRPTGMDVRAKRVRIGLEDVSRFVEATTRYLGDRDDPTLVSPVRVIQQRFRRIARVQLARAARVWDAPVPGEAFVLFPLHFQPEATTLVRAPMYLDQVALLEDIAKSLPAGHRLYVKEHVSSRGRRPLEHYQRIRAIPAARLLGPDEDTWALIRDASVVAVISGTVGWEGLLFDKPVVTFGDAFFNFLPQVYRAGAAPKDAWYEIFKAAATRHRPDREATHAMIAALHEASYPGFIANPNTFPAVLVPDNIAHITAALVREAGLAPVSHTLATHERQAT